MRAVLRSHLILHIIKFKALLTVSNRFGEDKIFRYVCVKDVTVNRDDIAFVACRACVSVFKNRGGKKSEKEEKRRRLDHP